MRRALALILSAMPWAAQAVSAQAPAIADIVVTAEKRPARMQSAPLAITALDAADLATRNLNQVTDLNGYVPGLIVSKSEGAERIITIRGIGYETAQNPNSQPGVAFHIDGVYVANVLALNQDWLDVDRIEVLRGPQGTVFGETSTGGAIDVITVKPVIGEASGTASLAGGTRRFVKAVGTVNLPVSETIAMRASAQFLEHGPYGYATAVPGRRRYGLDDAFNLGLRASILWRPTDRFSATLSGQHFGQDRAASLQKDVTDPDPRPRRVTQDFPGRFRIRTDMAYLTLEQAVGDAALLRSVSAIQWLDKHQSSDNDRLASPAYFDDIVFWQDRSRTVTQELTLASTGTRRLDWTVGAFLLDQHARQHVIETTNPAFAALVLPDGTGIKFQTDSPYRHRSAAGYANLAWHLTDRLSLIGGARYNRDRIAAAPVQLFRAIPPKAATSRAVTGRAGAEYRFTPASMAYLTYARGYKPTGLNFNNPGLLVGGSFAKETLDAVELGTKNEFLAHRLRLNLAAYHYWYRDMQFTAEDPIPFSGGTANIPRARIWGAEVEFSALPFAGLRIDGDASYGRGRITAHYLAIDAQTAAAIRRAAAVAIGCPAADVGCYYAPSVIDAVRAGAQDVDGNPIPKLPRWQARVSPSYSWAMAGGTVTVRGDVIHRGGFDYRLFAIGALDRVPAYTIVNAFVAYQPDARPWAISFTAQNVGDRAGINSRFSDPYGSGTTSVEYIDPRQIFATISFRF